MKESELILENILQTTKLPKNKIFSALKVIHYQEMKKLDAMFEEKCPEAKRGCFGNPFLDIYYDVLDMAMPKKTRQEAERLLDLYNAYLSQQLKERS